MLKILVVVLVLACLIGAFFYYQGVMSTKLTPPAISDGALPVCGAKPNCVCSLQDPSDDHYIEAIDLGGRGIAEVSAAIESIGGKITATDGAFIQAIFTSGIFRFVDDLVVQVDDGRLQVRSSSRVGHSDLGANRKRIELLRSALL